MCSERLVLVVSEGGNVSNYNIATASYIITKI